LFFILMNKPLEASCDQAAAEPGGGHANPAQRILVVEDDRDLRLVNAGALTHSGYAVDVAEDGAAAWEALQANHNDLVITDNQMPKLGAPAYRFSALIGECKDKRFFDCGISNESEGRVLNHGLLDWREGFGARCCAQGLYEIATGNYPKLESELRARPKTTLTSPGTDQASPSAFGARPVRAYFAHPQSLIDEGVSIGQGTRIWAFAHVLSRAILGEDCNICDHTFVEGGVRMGNRVTVKCGVFLWDGLTVEDDVFIGPAAVFTNDDRPRSKRQLKAYPQTVLKQGCTLGAGSTTLPGITVGRWAMVGAGAIVTHDVPDYALVVGNPARWRAWVCRCGENLFPTSGRLLGCACGRTYEQIAENEVREFAANGSSSHNLAGNRVATDLSESINKNHGHQTANGLHV
jgi:acetyltransferase-like isoleucine patch superfamily enzyme